MCRFLAYKGSRILMNDLLYRPKNSLIQQSIHARELEEPLNGDGFGVGWYAPEIDIYPATFVSVSPAWSNQNLQHLASKIQSPCFLAHVRAASVGNVTENNCHPFNYKTLLMMHNGGIDNFYLIKRDLRNELSDELYNWIKGETDSEHIFALFIDKLNKTKDPTSIQSMVESLEATIKYLNELKKKHNLENEPSYLNLAVTNGTILIAVRYISDPKEDALTLYYSQETKYVCEKDICHMIQASPDDWSVLVVSEKLTDLETDWKMIPKNHFLIVEEDLSLTLKSIQA